MRSFRTLIVGLALMVTAAACSTMDDVVVLHRCGEEVAVTVRHVQVHGSSDSGTPGYTVTSQQGTVPPNEETVVTGIINLEDDDLVQVVVEASGWERELTRRELRDLDGPILLPAEACP